MMEYLQSWQSKFQTCHEVWEEGSKKAMAIHLLPAEELQLAVLISKRNEIRQKIKTLEMAKASNKGVRFKEYKQLFDLEDDIRLFWQVNGYSDMLVRKDGLVGLKSIDGGMALPPIYDDICLTYDDFEFFHQQVFVVKKDDNWGLVDNDQTVLIPFVFDRIFRKAGSANHYILVKNGKQGVASIVRLGEQARMDVAVEMDAIYDVPGYDLLLFTQKGKWGWWFPGDSSIYDNYSDPEFDEVFVMPKEEVMNLEDDDDEWFTVRKGDNYYDILYWTSK